VEDNEGGAISKWGDSGEYARAWAEFGEGLMTWSGEKRGEALEINVPLVVLALALVFVLDGRAEDEVIGIKPAGGAGGRSMIDLGDWICGPESNFGYDSKCVWERDCERDWGCDRGCDRGWERGWGCDEGGYGIIRGDVLALQSRPDPTTVPGLAASYGFEASVLERARELELEEVEARGCKCGELLIDEDLRSNDGVVVSMKAEVVSIADAGSESGGGPMDIEGGELNSGRGERGIEGGRAEETVLRRSGGRGLEWEPLANMSTKQNRSTRPYTNEESTTYRETYREGEGDLELEACWSHPPPHWGSWRACLGEDGPPSPDVSRRCVDILSTCDVVAPRMRGGVDMKQNAGFEGMLEWRQVRDDVVGRRSTGEELEPNSVADRSQVIYTADNSMPLGSILVIVLARVLSCGRGGEDED
jgi:hypothetical protein